MSTRRNTASNRFRRVPLLEGLETRNLFAFGLTTSGSNLTVDTGAQTVFTVNNTNGDLTSIKFNGNELTAPFSVTSRYSHLNSGLGTATVTSQVNSASGWIKITVDTPDLTHYYIARNGFNNIYMATYEKTTFGELRYITYFDRTKFPGHNAASDISGKTVIEGSDVFADSTGKTYSKFYSSKQFINDPQHGITGTNLGAYMVNSTREKSSGGPFFKDIDEQGASGIELYNYMFSGHEQTETARLGLHGPYALAFTTGAAPGAIDWSFLSGLSLTGYVAASGRGDMGGTVVGAPTGPAVTVGLSNGTAQYWGKANATGGYHIGGILPGTYTATTYSGELAVGSQQVTITAGATTNVNLHPSGNPPAAVFRIGTWDGTPLEFKNEPNLNTMHPSDSRISAWGTSTNFTVGSSATNVLPAAQWKDVNNDTKLTFSLTSAQASVANTLRIGITDADAGGRPYIVVNEGKANAWTSALPAATTQPNSRSITRGTYRGNNFTFTYNIPLSALTAGTNTINIRINSGSGGTGFLSPMIVYDAIDLLATSTVPAAVAAASTTKTASTFSTTQVAPSNSLFSDENPSLFA